MTSSVHPSFQGADGRHRRPATRCLDQPSEEPERELAAAQRIHSVAVSGSLTSSDAMPRRFSFHRHQDSRSPLMPSFAANSSRPSRALLAMTRSGFEYILDKHVARAAGACPSLRDRSGSPHQLRHSCALLMLQATRDIRKVSLWLGHADVRTTEVYLRIDPSEKLEAMETTVLPALRRGRFKVPDALIASLLDGTPSSPPSARHHL
jgi:hypothetical protein